MSNINDVFGGTYLKAGDLIVNGKRRRVAVTIDDVKVREFDDGSKKLEISFVGKDKRLICNKTNATAIAEIHGEDYGVWAGKSITLFAGKTEFQGSRVDCIRVLHEDEAPPPPAMGPDEDDDNIPF